MIWHITNNTEDEFENNFILYNIIYKFIYNIFEKEYDFSFYLFKS